MAGFLRRRDAKARLQATVRGVDVFSRGKLDEIELKQERRGQRDVLQANYTDRT